MKRVICCLLIAAMALGLCACTTKNEKLVDPISFYYLHVLPPNQILHGNEHSLLAPEAREGQSIRNDLTILLTQYFQGPITESCQSPFPADTELVSWASDGSTLYITLTDQVASLTGIDLTLACACLTRTCLELGDFEAVLIQAETLMLDGKTAITMNKQNLLLVDDTISGEDSNKQNGG